VGEGEGWGQELGSFPRHQSDQSLLTRNLSPLPHPLPNLICGFMKFPCPQQYPQIFKESPGYTVQRACSELKHSRLLLINLFLNSANEISCAEKTPPPYIIFCLHPTHQT